MMELINEFPNEDLLPRLFFQFKDMLRSIKQRDSELRTCRFL
jgi:hypothetical protein